MYPAISGYGVSSSQVGLASQQGTPYSEEEILGVAETLLKEGEKALSEVPRLYIILRDIDQTGKHRQLLDELIKKGVNDLWLPITAEFTLTQILPEYLRIPFLQAQTRVCVLPTNFRLGLGSAHGHFPTTAISPFQRLQSIGEGRVGYVEKVLSLVDGCVYARKSIRKLSNYSHARDNVQMFRSELQALRRIKHKHCVEIVGSYTNPHYLAIILSPVADCNLKEYLERAENSANPILISQLREWFGCLAVTIQYLHKNQIRHRDIKPANILVYGTNVLLVDFGLSLDWRDLGQSTTTALCGRTPLYAAPEVMEGRSCNSKSDVWSLGCVFLEMITVVKGESISNLREHFNAESRNQLFSNNLRSINDWVSKLEKKSSTDNAPLQWIPMMLQSDLCLRSRSSAIVKEVRCAAPSRKDINPYFGACCQLAKATSDPRTLNCLLCTTNELKICSLDPTPCASCARLYETRIYRAPQERLDPLPVQHFISYLHPSFMIEHLSQTSMLDFEKFVVFEDRWEISDIDVRLACIPGHDLHATIRRFVPSRHLCTLRTHPDSKNIDLEYSLPIGIYRPNLAQMVIAFDAYLDNLVDNHLISYAEFIMRIRGHDRSSQALEAICKWLQTWKRRLPAHETRLLKSAIKLIAAQTILGLSLILEEVPDALTHDYLRGYSGPQPYHLDDQAPRLLNRQVKVAFFLVYKSLLRIVLDGLRTQVLLQDSWTTCLFLSICLAFLLENIDAGSQEFAYFSKNVYNEEVGNMSDGRMYGLEVDRVVFARMYRLLVLIGGKRKMGRLIDEQFSEALRQIELEASGDHKPSVSPGRAQYSSRLVSALVDLA